MNGSAPPDVQITNPVWKSREVYECLWDKDNRDGVKCVGKAQCRAVSTVTPIGKTLKVVIGTWTQLQAELLQTLLKVNLSSEQSEIAIVCVCVT